MGMSRPVTIKSTPTTKKKGSTQNTPKDTVNHDSEDSDASNDKDMSSIDNNNISTNQRQTREDSIDSEQRVSPPGDSMVEDDISMDQQSTSAPVAASRKPQKRKRRRISFPSKRKKISVKGKAQKLEKQPVPTTVKGKRKVPEEVKEKGSAEMEEKGSVEMEGGELMEVERRGPVKEDLTSEDESERSLNNHDSHYRSDCEDSYANDIQRYMFT